MNNDHSLENDFSKVSLQRSILQLEHDISTLMSSPKDSAITALSDLSVSQLIQRKLSMLEKLVFTLRDQISSYESNVALSQVIKQHGSIEDLLEENSKLKKEVEFYKQREDHYNSNALLERKLDSNESLLEIVSALQNELININNNKSALLARMKDFVEVEANFLPFVATDKLDGFLENSIFELTSLSSFTGLESASTDSIELLAKLKRSEETVEHLSKEKELLYKEIESREVKGQSKKVQLLSAQNSELLQELRNCNQSLTKKDYLCENLTKYNAQLAQEKASLSKENDLMSVEIVELKRLLTLLSKKSNIVEENFKKLFSISVSLVGSISNSNTNANDPNHPDPLLQELCKNAPDVLSVLINLIDCGDCSLDSNHDVSQSLRKILNLTGKELISQLKEQVSHEINQFKSEMDQTHQDLIKTCQNLLLTPKSNRYCQASPQLDAIERNIQYDPNDIEVEKPNTSNKSRKANR
ncbi:hypothetical protein P9112_001987 [Eukaryota sp. TZLM1-RC]